MQLLKFSGAIVFKVSVQSVVGRITASTLVYILTLGAGEHFSLHAKRNFAGIIKLRSLINEEIILGHPGEPDTVTWVLISREPFPAVFRGRYDYRRRVREMICCGLWRWSKVPWAKPGEPGEGQEIGPPLGFQEEHRPRTPWFQPEEICVGLLTYKIKVANLCGFKPLSRWQFVSAATRS